MARIRQLSVVSAPLKEPLRHRSRLNFSHGVSQSGGRNWRLPAQFRANPFPERQPLRA